jgi:phosphoribosylformylglycinamidine cyclo-ligase
MTTQNNSGIDTENGSSCSKIAYGWAKKTFANRNNEPGEIRQRIDGLYATMLDFNGLKIGISSDGIGTKVEIAERTGIYDTLGFDLVAMTVDDLAVNGFVPTSLSNILDVDILDHTIVDSLMKGLYDAANFSKIAVTGGEIAELGNRIGGYGDRMHFNWCATGIGVLHKNLSDTLDGSKIIVDDLIISVRNPGFRSNGFSLLRNILTENYGKEWHKKSFDANNSWGEVALTPSLIYAPVITKLLDNNLSIHGIAHITGGGVVDNLGRLLKINKKGALLDNVFAPGEAVKELIHLGNVSLAKAYRYWNMGNGLLIVIPRGSLDETLDLINDTESYQAQCAGKIIEDYKIEIQLHEENLIYTDLGVK